MLIWAIPLISLLDILLSSILSKRLVRYEVIVRSFAEPFVLTILSFAFFHLGYSSAGLILAFVLAMGFASLLAATFAFRLFEWKKSLRVQVNWSILNDMARKSFSTCLHDLARVLVSRIDTFAVGYFFNTSAVGLYGMAQQFLTIIEKVALSFHPMLMPVVSQAVKASDWHRLFAQLRSAVIRLVLLQLPIVLLSFFYGQTLLDFIGPQFSDAWPVLMILTLGCWINAVFQLIEIPLTFIRPHANVIGASIAIGAYLLVVGTAQSRFGLNGVASSSVFAGIVSNIIIGSIFMRSVGHRTRFTHAGQHASKK